MNYRICKVVDRNLETETNELIFAKLLTEIQKLRQIIKKICKVTDRNLETETNELRFAKWLTGMYSVQQWTESYRPNLQ